MKKLTLAGLSAVLLAQLCFSQQAGPLVRAGDTFRGSIKQVRSERAQYRSENGALVEGPRVLSQILVQSTKTSGTGATIETSINTIDRSQPPVANSPAKKSIWTTTKEDGSRIENIFEVDASGNHNDQQSYYAADGSFLGKRIAQTDAEAKRLQATQDYPDSSVKSRSLETREYDAKRNLIKLMHYSWNAKLEKFEPLAVSYHTISYR